MTWELRQSHLPYCIKRLKDGRFIVLNRNYKPLGIHDSDFVDYDAHPSVVEMSMTPTRAKRISYEGNEDIETIYLYNDGCVPTRSPAHMNAYCARLAALMKLQFKHH